MCPAGRSQLEKARGLNVAVEDAAATQGMMGPSFRFLPAEEGVEADEEGAEDDDEPLHVELPDTDFGLFTESAFGDTSTKAAGPLPLPQEDATDGLRLSSHALCSASCTATPSSSSSSSIAHMSSISSVPSSASLGSLCFGVYLSLPSLGSMIGKTILPNPLDRNLKRLDEQAWPV